MKKSLVKLVMLTIAVVGMTVLFSETLFAQDTVIEKPHKVMKIKVDVDEDGNSFFVDTSFVIDENFSMKEFEEAMAQYKVQMKDVGKYLKELEIELDGEELEYLYEPRNVHFFGRPDGCSETVRVNARKRGESLSDVLGNIPMSAVTSYKIKETKNGKRITIEVSDNAFFGNDEE